MSGVGEGICRTFTDLKCPGVPLIVNGRRSEKCNCILSPETIVEQYE